MFHKLYHKRSHMPEKNEGSTFKYITNACSFRGEWLSGDLSAGHIFSIRKIMSPKG